MAVSLDFFKSKWSLVNLESLLVPLLELGPLGGINLNSTLFLVQLISNEIVTPTPH